MINPLRTFISHFKEFQKALDEWSIEANLQIHTFHVQSKFPYGIQKFYPQFLIPVDNGVEITPLFTENITGFAGWRPYEIRSIPLLSDKIQFKKLLAVCGIATPEFSEDSNCQWQDVIVKNKFSSFSRSIKGPFKKASDYFLKKEKGEYFERFTFGKIVKSWHLQDQPICWEIHSMPTLSGDGVSTIQKILQKQQAHVFHQGRNLDRINCILNYFNKTMSSVLQAGDKQLIDFRYGSPFNSINSVTTVRLEESDDPDLSGQLIEISEILWDVVGTLLEGTLYTIDGIYTDDGLLWMLEANANPILHPYVYSAMIQQLVCHGERID